MTALALPLEDLQHRHAIAELLRENDAIADEVFAPQTTPRIAEWAEEERILPRSSSSEGGPFRNDRIPYLRGVMDALDNPRVPTVVLMKGAQVAGTTIGENWVGWTMRHSPAPMLAVWPTEKLLRRWSLTRLDPLIEETPSLARLFDRSGLRDSSDSIGHKEFPNGTFDLLTARSSSDLRSISAARIWFSEVDNIIAELTEDGDPIELARSRGETYWDYKEYFESTPTVAGASRIFDELQRTSWCEWWMPCPHCDESQVLRWQDGMEDGEVDTSENVTRRFTWEVDAHGDPVLGTVSYVCEHCAALIPEFKKQWMLERGEWRARFPDRLAQGFHIPAYISPLISWNRIAQRFVRAQKSEARMRTFVNNICGMPYTEKASRVSVHFLQQRAEKYAAQVPAGVKVIVAGGDVQGSEGHFSLWGFGAGEEAWLLKWEIIEGEVSRRSVRRAIHEFLRTPLLDETGKKRYIAATCIDARYNTGAVHKLCREFSGPNGAKLIPIIGLEGRGRPVLSDPPQRARRRAGARAMRSRWVGIDGIKDMLFSRLQLVDAGPECIHFPVEGLDPAFYLQLTAEELKTEYVKRRPVRRWRKKEKDLANEALDTTVYAYAALHSLGGKIVQQLAKLADATKLANAEMAEVVDIQLAAAAKPAAKRRLGPRVHSRGVY